jgi:hypothetical protein
MLADRTPQLSQQETVKKMVIFRIIMKTENKEALVDFKEIGKTVANKAIWSNIKQAQETPRIQNAKQTG